VRVDDGEPVADLRRGDRGVEPRIGDHPVGGPAGRVAAQAPAAHLVPELHGPEPPAYEDEAVGAGVAVHHDGAAYQGDAAANAVTDWEERGLRPGDFP